MEIKDILKKRRKELGLTLLEVAKNCNVSEATVSRWESGDIGDMKRSRIAALAKVLDVSPSIIVGIEEDDYSLQLGDYETTTDPISNHPDLYHLYETISSNDQLIVLLDKAKKLSPEDLAQVLRIIDTFNK